jgi:hypothetical protein
MSGKSSYQVWLRGKMGICKINCIISSSTCIIWSYQPYFKPPILRHFLLILLLDRWHASFHEFSGRTAKYQRGLNDFRLARSSDYGLTIEHQQMYNDNHLLSTTELHTIIDAHDAPHEHRRQFANNNYYYFNVLLFLIVCCICCTCALCCTNYIINNNKITIEGFEKFHYLSESMYPLMVF